MQKGSILDWGDTKQKINQSMILNQISGLKKQSFSLRCPRWLNKGNLWGTCIWYISSRNAESNREKLLKFHWSKKTKKLYQEIFQNSFLDRLIWSNKFNIEIYGQNMIFMYRKKFFLIKLLIKIVFEIFFIKSGLKILQIFQKFNCLRI